MNCETVSELLPELLNGTLEGQREAAALLHLAGCPACRGELAFWARVAGAVKAEAEPLPAGLLGEVRKGIFGAGAETLFDSLKLAGQALGLARSACRLAYAAAMK